MTQSMREALSEAIDAAEDDTDVSTNEASEEAPVEAEAASEEPSDASADEDTSISAAIDDATPQDDAPTDDAAAEASSDDAVDDAKAPVDWGPEVREEWKGLPKSVQDHITAREQHVNQTLQDGAQHRKLGENFLQLSEPYKAIMDAEGARSPLEAVEGLFKTVGTLRMGSPDQKAAMMAQLINVYGVDINMLDSALVGGAPQEVDPASAAMDAKLAPINQFIDQFNNQQTVQAQNTQARIGEDMNTFAQKAEFFNDVRMDMADFMDAASRNNQAMSLQQAYDKACAIHPGISGVMSKRASDKALLEGSNNMANKRAAAASINGSSNGPGSAKPTSLRGTVEAAFAEHS